MLGELLSRWTLRTTNIRTQSQWVSDLTYLWPQCSVLSRWARGRAGPRLTVPGAPWLGPWLPGNLNAALPQGPADRTGNSVIWKLSGLQSVSRVTVTAAARARPVPGNLRWYWVGLVDSRRARRRPDSNSEAEPWLLAWYRDQMTVPGAFPGGWACDSGRRARGQQTTWMSMIKLLLCWLLMVGSEAIVSSPSEVVSLK